MRDRIVDHIYAFICRFPQEKHIIFFGDYMYHFRYDRSALLHLFGLFVKLFREGKSVYILAGNHDRIGGHFLYAEAKRTFNLFRDHKLEGNIFFITQARFFSIEGQDCLFLPYNVDIDINKYEAQDLQNSIDRQYDVFRELLGSSHAKERLSGKINILLNALIHKWRRKNETSSALFVFHHRYIANKKFPGIQGSFSFKSPAIDESFLQYNDIRLISGHIHHSFSQDNYLCLGSVWATSPLEANHRKYCFQYDAGKDIVNAYPMTINAFIAVQCHQGNLQSIDRKHLENTLLEYMHHAHDFFRPCVRKVNIAHNEIYNIQFDDFWKHVVVYFMLDKHRDGNHFSINEDLYSFLGDIYIKYIKNAKNRVADMKSAHLRLGESIQDWKYLLIQYLKRRYSNESVRYREILEELGIV